MNLQPVMQRDRYTLHRGDCLAVLRTLPDASVHAVVTDPPYGLSFMGNRWDYQVPSAGIWAQCLRVLKPGGHLLSFAGARTHHRMACNIEDGGFEIRDMIAWVYGQGFPKSLNLDGDWQGFGTALKPALEPITLARKPLIGTVAENVDSTGCGALNIDGCRVGIREKEKTTDAKTTAHAHHAYGRPSGGGKKLPPGRWPANLIHDGSPEVLAGFPVTGPAKAAPRGGTNPNPMDWGNVRSDGDVVKGHNDTGGSAARFFYCAKASKADREEGLHGLPDNVLARSCQAQAEAVRGNAVEESAGAFNVPRKRKNHHATVKPTSLMRYLCRLVTPPGGTVLDPFMGSGSTGKAAMLEGFHFIGIDLDEDDHGNPAGYIQLAAARIAHASTQYFREPQPPCNPLSDPGKP